MIEKVAKSGFNALRIPVTWSKFTSKDPKTGKFVISRDWLNRVHEVADYGLKNGMIVIVNMHHDDKIWINVAKSGSEWDAILEQYRQMWEIIADEFKNCDENLILEAANEIVAGEDWWGKDDVFFERQNALYRVFWKTVRSSGGKNAQRYLMLPTYGAQWYAHQYEKIWFPENDSHIICDIHWYSADTNPETYENTFPKMADFFQKRNVGFVFGECGLQKSNAALAADWAPAFIGTAKKYGIPCMLWDDGGNFQILARKYCVWNNDEYVSAVLDAADGKTKSVRKVIATEIQYQNWYCNGGACVINSNGSAKVTSGSDFVHQVQTCFNLPAKSVAALKKLAGKSKDGFVYIDFTGSFETGANENKLFIKGALCSGGGWEIGKDWEFTLISGGKITIPFPVSHILSDDQLALTLQLNNYTYGKGIRNLKMTISTPYCK